MPQPPGLEDLNPVPMSASKLSELLPIPDAASDPHAYQIFGLADGEQDTEKIDQAVKATVQKIKAAKSSTDPKLWSTAARLVQDARITLTDPDKKAQLDARFGIITIPEDEDDAQPSPPSPSAADPLAAVLPSADPLASVLPQSDPLAVTDPMAPVQPPAPASVPPPPDAAAPTPSSPAPFGTPQAPAQPAMGGAHQHGAPHGGAPESTMQPAAVVVKQPKRQRRRRSSWIGVLIFMTFTLGMIGVIGLLGYFVLYGPGQVAISSNDGQLTISTQPPDPNAQPEVSPPYEVRERERRPIDPVMGDLGGNVPPPESSESSSNGETLFSGDSSLGGPPQMQQPSPTTASNAAPDMESEPGMDPASNPDAAPNMEDEPEPEPLSDEMIAQADAAMDRVEDLIRKANWQEMKGAAEAAVEMRMTDQQKAKAEALFEIADLATYYRGGIQKAVAELQVGADFEVRENFRMIVVETGDDLLVLRANARNHSMKFDEFPFSLAHKLATFAVPDSSTGVAAKSVYQAISPRTNDEYRAEAVGWLRDIQGEVEGADPQRAADTIEELFAGDS